MAVRYAALCACRKVHTWRWPISENRSISILDVRSYCKIKKLHPITGWTDRQTDRRTDRQNATQYAAPPREEGRIIITIACFCKKNPKRTACASLVDREEERLRWRLKDERERLLSLRWAGREFQFEGPAYANERPPYVASFTRGKSRWPRSADRRWRRTEMPETGWHRSRSTGIQEPSCADIWTPGRRLWTKPSRQRPASVVVPVVGRRS